MRVFLCDCVPFLLVSEDCVEGERKLTMCTCSLDSKSERELVPEMDVALPRIFKLYVATLEKPVGCKHGSLHLIQTRTFHCQRRRPTKTLKSIAITPQAARSRNLSSSSCPIGSSNTGPV